MATAAKSRPTLVERVLRIQRSERVLVVWLVSLFTMIQSSHALGANVADALFFQRFGVDNLPLMILLTGPAVMISVLAHGSGLAYRGPARWLPTVTMICAAWAGVEWVGARFDVRGFYPVIWISTQVIIMVSLTVMWNAASSASTTRQAKRLFPIFATAGVAGGVVGNLLTGPLANLLGTPNLLLAQAVLLFGGSLLVLRARPLFGIDDDHPESVLAGLSNTWATIRSSRFLVTTAGIAVALFCLFYLVYFPFSESVAMSFGTEAETAGFLGIFSSIATAATFLFSLFVTNRLFARLGLVATLMIVPALYAAGFGTWLIVFTLPTAAVVRGLQWVAVNAVALTAYTALFNVVSRRERGQVASFMTAVPAQIGVSLAGLVLIITSGGSIQSVFVVGLLISLVTVVTVIGLRREYLDAVVSAVRQGVIGLFDTPSRSVVTPRDADALRILKDHLNDPRPGARALAVAGLGRLGTSSDAPALEPLLADADPRVRSAAFDSVCVIEPERVSAHAADAITDEVPEVRLQVLHYLASHPEEEGSSIARTALTDPDVRVRAAAAVLVGGEAGDQVIGALLDDDEPLAVAAVLTETTRADSSMEIDPTPYLHHRSPLVRAIAADAAVEAGLDPSELRSLLDDRSPRVRLASARALARIPEGKAVLVDVLATGSVSASESALKALAPAGELFDEFTDWARREAERAALLMSYARGIDIPDPSPARRYLLSVLETRSRRLIQWVLIAMTTDETQGVMPLVGRGVESSDPETQSQAIEALETVGARQVLRVLLPLLESEDAFASRAPDEALVALSDDFDPWLRSLAERVRAEEDGAGITVASLTAMNRDDRLSILDTMDRVLVLQRVHMLSELDPEDLDLIARVTTEEVYEPGAPIYVEGETGDEMLVIVEGSAAVTVTEDDQKRMIHTYGPGDHVGELSLLIGGSRSADVNAGDEGLRGLALSADDLLTVLEERPAVAMGMLGTLAKRLIEQT